MSELQIITEHGATAEDLIEKINRQADDLKLASQEWCSVNALLKGAEARALEHRSRAELADRQLTMAVNTLREISTSSASKAIRDKARRALEKLENTNFSPKGLKGGDTLTADDVRRLSDPNRER